MLSEQRSRNMRAWRRRWYTTPAGSQSPGPQGRTRAQDCSTPFGKEQTRGHEEWGDFRQFEASRARQQLVVGTGASFGSTRNRGKVDLNVPGLARAPRHIRLLIFVFAVCAFLAVYKADSASNDGRAKKTVVYGDLLNGYQLHDRDVLRMRTDAARNRLWVLTLENVHVYDIAGRMLLRRIRLPGWSVADFDYARPPDIALDDRGTAVISNNVEPRLLEIDPSTFQTKEHQLRLTSRKHWETGFGSLQFMRDGTLLAVSTTGEAVFRIDLRNGKAQEIQSTSH